MSARYRMDKVESFSDLAKSAIRRPDILFLHFFPLAVAMWQPYEYTRHAEAYLMNRMTLNTARECNIGAFKTFRPKSRSFYTEIWFSADVLWRSVIKEFINPALTVELSELLFLRE
jgi:hypothetical protein